MQKPPLKSSLSIRIDLLEGVRFGPGKANLLRALAQEGSIKAAASALGMSYPRALKLIEQMNTGFAALIVETKLGGMRGGGATLTPTGRRVLSLYEQICSASEVASHHLLAELQEFLAD